LTVAMPPNQPLATRSSAVALSPDGSRMALVTLQDGVTHLGIRDFSSFDVRLLPGTEGAEMPFFSPDGEWLGFFADGKLKKILASGGAAIIIASVQNFSGGTWLRDGTIVYTPDWSGGMYRVPASGGKPELLMPLEPGKE